jgi:class 3 adenylate cyclase/TolB-like protein
MQKTGFKSTSIFFSDIVGYSSMIARNETAALHLLDEHDIILKKHIKNNNGTIIKHIGDAIFSEFDNSNRALKASIEIQKELKCRNENTKGSDNIVVRIGLHYGNVVVKRGDLFGNDVNICARIEPVAIPGGIACSHQFLSKIADDNLFTRSYGKVRLKNIPDATELFRIYIDKKDYFSERYEDLINILIGRGVKLVSHDEKIDNYKTIGILYPDNLGRKEEDFFCYSFLEKIIEDLQKIDEIRTPSIFDVKKYKGSDQSISQISIDLAVQNIAQLSILSVGEKFKVNVYLTSMDTGEGILSKSWEASHNELNQISGSIVASFADVLSVKLPDSIKKLFKKIDQVDNEAYKKYLEGNYLVKINKSLDKSATLLKQSIDLDRNFSKPHATLGLNRNLMGDYDAAEKHLDDALHIAENNNDRESLSIVYNNYGLIYKEQRRFDKAISFFNKGLKIQKTLQNEHMYANLLHNMSTCYGLCEQNDLWINYLEQSQRIYEKLELEDRLANSYATMGNAYKSTGDYQSAIEYYDKAKGIFLSENITYGYAQTLIVQSECFRGLQKYDKAEETLYQALEISKDFKQPLMNGRIHLASAYVDLDKKALNDALDSFEESLDIFSDLNNKLRVSEILVQIGSIYLKKNKLKISEKYYKRASKMIAKLKNKKLSLDIQNFKKKLDEYIESN